MTLDEKIFGSDPKITALYRQFLLGCDWQQKANQLYSRTHKLLERANGLKDEEVAG